MRYSRLPLFRIGGVLIVLGGLLEALEALGALDISSLLPAGCDAGLAVAIIGLVKIVLRFVIVLLTFFSEHKGT